MKDSAIAKRKVRKDSEKEARRMGILRSAVKVFSENGFVKTSMEQVADEAALAVGTLYRYYKSKEELYVSIVFDAITIMHDGLEEIVESDDPPAQKLEMIWNYFYQFHEENPMYYQAFLFLHDPSFAGAFSEVAQKLVARFSSKNFRLLARVIQQGIDAGIFHPDKPQEVADYLWSLFVGLVNLAETRKHFGATASHLEQMHRAAWKKIQRSIVST
ncbi:MAG: TetR/AcrR family transcriptional regulator [Zoogloeaceae bacterium]|jgi:Transcriptional regulator|nr:TetR/AcrR family transcriptional regulator [Zoogloeaceae bacterium]